VLDGEAVIHRNGRVHVLDPVATLVWQCCDGAATVDQIAAELAAVFATPAATVARDVTDAIEHLAVLDLVRAATDEPEPAGETLELLVDPPGSCASCADRVWTRRRTFRVGPHLISVGTDCKQADTAIATALAAHLVTTPPALLAQPPFFAVELHDRGSGRGPQPLDLLHRGDTVVARSRRPDRIARALMSQLASYGDLRAAGLAVVNGLVVTLGDRAMIVTAPRDAIRFRHALADEGVLVSDLPVALFDPSRGEVVVGAPGLQVDPEPIEILAGEPVEHEPEPPRWGRYRVTAVAVPAPASPAAALLAFGPEIGDHRDHDTTLDALLALLDSVPVTDAVEPDAIAAFLAAS
jgi:hypothetical protein